MKSFEMICLCSRKKKIISMTIPNSSCSFTEKKERNPQLRQSQFTRFFIGVNNLLYQKIKHFRDKNIFISEQWPNLKNKRFSIEESKEFRIKIIWQGVYKKYKTLESSRLINIIQRLLIKYFVENKVHQLTLTSHILTRSRCFEISREKKNNL